MLGFRDALPATFPPAVPSQREEEEEEEDGVSGRKRRARGRRKE